MDKLVIRKAKAEDCTDIFKLIKELAVYEKAPNEVETNPEMLKETGFSGNPIWHGLVAEFNGKVIGFAIYYIRFSTWKGPRMYLEDFYVQEQLRGLGIGKQLFDQLLKICIQQEFNGMVWQVLDWNTPALNFYAKYEAHMDAEWVNGSLSKSKIQQIQDGGL